MLGKRKKNVEKEHLNYTHRKQELIMVLFSKAMNIHIISILVCFSFRNDFVETDFLVVIIFFLFNLRFGFYYLEIHHIPFGFNLIIIFCIVQCCLLHRSFQLQLMQFFKFLTRKFNNSHSLLQINDLLGGFSFIFLFLFHRYDSNYYLLIVFQLKSEFHTFDRKRKREKKESNTELVKKKKEIKFKTMHSTLCYTI